MRLPCAWGAVLLFACAAGTDSPIHFRHQPVAFTLDACETPERHVPETMAGGLAVFDYNNDSYLDIFFLNGADIRTLKKAASRYSNRLFANDGKGRFTDVTQRAGLAGGGYDNAAAVADYDNDGYKDLFLGGVHGNRLYRNNRDGTFADVTRKAGIDSSDRQYGPLWSVGAVWLDADNDGFLDLFVVNYLSWSIATEPPCLTPGGRDYCHPKFYKPLPNQLFLSNGDGTFKDVSAGSGIRAHPGKGMGAAAADFDLDGRMDIFVTNDKLDNFFFRNKGGGKFEEVAFEVNVALRDNPEWISGMGADFRDIDNDGYPDIVFVALDNETFPVFRNTGKSDFTDVTARSGMSAMSLSMAGYSPTVSDFDNDGWKDLFVTRGHVQAPSSSARFRIEQPNTVFRNLGGLKFAASTAEAGLASAPAKRHRGSALGDLNADGRVDVVVSAIGAAAEIWINDSPGGHHWLALELEGTRSNRDGIGARIKVVARGVAQYNHVSFGVGYASSSAGPVHFGLGPADSADLVEIRWPSGTVQELKNVAAGRVVRIRESGPLP